MMKLRGIPSWFWLPALLALLALTLPLVGMASRVPWADLGTILASESSVTALWLSLRTCLVSTAVSLVIGCPLALIFARAGELPVRPRWLTPVRALVLVPLVMPPVVAGLALLATFGRRGVFGPALEAVGIQVPFTTLAVVLAQIFVSLPYLVMTVETAARAAGSDLEHAARGLGASRWVQFSRITLPLLAPSIASGASLAFARSLGEFGATITFAGSMQGTTRTLPLEVYLQREQDPAAALALALVLIVFALALTGLTSVLEARNMRRFAHSDHDAGHDTGHDTGSGVASSGLGDAAGFTKLAARTASKTNQTAAAAIASAPDPAASAPGQASSMPVQAASAATAAVGPGRAANTPEPGPTNAPSEPSPAPAPFTLVAHVPERKVAYELTGEPGETLALIGPNGSGKSTGLRLLAGDITSPTARVDVPDTIGFLDQSPSLFPHMSVLDNVAFGPRCHGLSKTAARQRARAELATVGLADLADRAPAQLSGGQAQRVALARVLAVDPQLLLLDEPFAALDAASADALRSLIAARTRGLTTVIVTHDLIDVLSLADRVAVLDAGRLADLGPTSSCLTNPATAFAAEFAGLNMQFGHVTGGVLQINDAKVQIHGQLADVHEGARAAAVFDPRAVALRAVPPSAVSRGTVPHGEADAHTISTDNIQTGEAPSRGTVGRSSVRNAIPGTVTSIQASSVGVDVRLDIGSTTPLRALITAAAASELGITVGTELVAEVKAMQVRIIPVRSASRDDSQSAGGV
ncbi:ABC transporter permease [Trueperella bialowiezensis]|uniref:Sulfate/thiosulfate import ATP-binding protein CysA n=1 Tax=Trueperella bialowiezensis TaxID=312285 RepID=A0A3S4X5M2_9ACTO|nr:ABC transporter permease [Trueperella bialowiezensis]VEI13176.1 Sulfate/thiosulfate import ATP-binding protein CysA [Trueperella bialowiezensis]